MKNLVKKALLVTATATGLALLGATGSAFASTAPSATSAVQGATHAATQQASDNPVSDVFPTSDDATTNNGDVTPSVEQSVKRWNRGGAMVGGGAASMVSSAWVGIPQQVLTSVKQASGGDVTQVTDHIHG